MEPSEPPIALAMPCSDEHRGACRGPLAPGAFVSTLYTPKFGYTVPAGWDNFDDDWDTFGLGRVGSDEPGDAPGIYMFRDPAVASSDDPCAEERDPAVGRGVDDVVGWLTSHPGLAMSEVGGADIGGLSGTVLTMRVNDGWTQICPWSDDTPVVPLFAYPRGHFWALFADNTMRTYLLEMPDDGVVAIHIQAATPESYAEIEAEAEAIVESFTFVLEAPMFDFEGEER